MFFLVNIFIVRKKQIFRPRRCSYFFCNLFIGLFQKAIMQSGCMFNSWAFQKNHREVAFAFAKTLGCQKDEPKEIVQYLRNLPAVDLVESIKSIVSKLKRIDQYFCIKYFQK